MCWLRAPSELTRTQSRSSSGVAPHLGSSERNNPVAAAVLLHIWNTQSFLLRRCCARSGTSWIFAKILHDSRVPQSLRSQVSDAFLRLHHQVFFLVFINLAISEIWLSSSTFDFSPTREAQFLDTASSISLMHLLARTQSRSSSSDVAPHLESSERNDTYTVLLQRAVLLQIWNTQSS